MALFLNGGGLEKARKLNPYKRISRGVEVNVVVNGDEVVAVRDNAGKYTYLNVGGVDYYVSAGLEAGTQYTTEEVVPKTAEEKAAERAAKAQAAADAPPSKRKRKAPAAEEATAAE